MEAWQCEVRKTNPGSLPQVGKVDGFAEIEAIGKDQVDEIAYDATKQNGKTAQWPRCIDSNKCNSKHCDNSHPGIKLAGSGIANCHRSQVQTDGRDDHTGDGRWHQVLDPPVACKDDDKTNDSVNHACCDDTA